MRVKPHQPERYGSHEPTTPVDLVLRQRDNGLGNCEGIDEPIPSGELHSFASDFAVVAGIKVDHRILSDVPRVSFSERAHTQSRVAEGIAQ